MLNQKLAVDIVETIELLKAHGYAPHDAIDMTVRYFFPEPTRPTRAALYPAEPTP